VYIIFLIKSGKAKKVIRLSQFSSQLETALGYLEPHFSWISSKGAVAK